MQDAGVTHIWLPPPSQSVAAQGYLPGQLYNLDSKYGSKDELKALNAALKEAGIVPLADIVINHRCADEKGEDGVYNAFRSAVSVLFIPRLNINLCQRWAKGGSANVCQ